MSLKHIVANFIRTIKKGINGILLVNKNISIISNNCWGGYMCQYSGIQYNSPFVGIFFFAEDYINLLQHINVIYEPFTFIDRKESKYLNHLSDKQYPIGYWSKYDIEIHFLHFKSKEECVEKWNRRLKRLDMNNLIVKFSEKDLCSESLIRIFNSLPYNNKVCFTCKPYPQYKTVIFLHEQNKLKEVNYCWEISDKYWNFVEHANKINEPNYSLTLFAKILLRLASYIKIPVG